MITKNHTNLRLKLSQANCKSYVVTTNRLADSDQDSMEEAAHRVIGLTGHAVKNPATVYVMLTVLRS